VRPSELVLGLRRNGLWTSRIAGIGYDFAVGEWSATRDLSVNYILVAARR
jgi:2-polyprenyl-3-methyl-5-hydroxy-6-metoxy-1,4-benzoquinol methylase